MLLYLCFEERVDTLPVRSLLEALEKHHGVHCETGRWQVRIAVVVDHHGGTYLFPLFVRRRPARLRVFAVSPFGSGFSRFRRARIFPNTVLPALCCLTAFTTPGFARISFVSARDNRCSAQSAS